MGLQDDLRRCLESRSWTSVRGTFDSRGAPPVRFVFRRPGDWRFESTIDDDVLVTVGAEQRASAKPEYAWLGSGGTLLAASPHGRASGGGDLPTLLEPERAILVPERVLRYLKTPRPTTYEQLAVSETSVDGRPAWAVTSGDDTILVDQAHGIAFRRLRPGEDAAIRDLEVDPDLSDHLFTPPPSRPGTSRARCGVVYVSEEDIRDRRFTSTWEIHRPSGLGYTESGPPHSTAGQAVAWARERAQTIILRTADGTRYSAGEQPPGEPLPPWTR